MADQEFTIIDDTADADPHTAATAEADEIVQPPPVAAAGLFSPEQSASLYRLVRSRSLGFTAFLLYLSYGLLLLIGLIPAVALVLGLLYHGSAAIDFRWTYNGVTTRHRSPEWVGYAIASVCTLGPWLLAHACLRASKAFTALRRVAKGSAVAE